MESAYCEIFWSFEYLWHSVSHLFIASCPWWNDNFSSLHKPVIIDIKPTICQFSSVQYSQPLLILNGVFINHMHLSASIKK